MRRIALASLALAPVLLAAQPATAGNLTAGVGIGLTQDKADSQGDSTSAYNLFGRLRFGKRVSGQLEIGKIDQEYEPKFYTATGLLLLDLTDPARGNLVPTLLVGLGIDRQQNDYLGEVNGQHIEGGVGLEYRAPGGLVIGADVRIGARQVDEVAYAVPAYDDGTMSETPRKGGGSSLAPCPPDSTTCGGYDYLEPSSMHSGEYRSVRITLAIHFQ